MADNNRPQDQSQPLKDQAQADTAKSESTGERPDPRPAPSNAPTGVAQTPGGPTGPVAPTASRQGNSGEPLANANARQGMTANRLNDDAGARGDTLVAAETRPLPVNNRLMANEQDGYHYHWFGDDVMRVERGKQLGYEFADASGDAVDYDKAAKMGGLVRMRVQQSSWDERRNRLNRVITPQAERAAREQFVATGEALDQDVQPFDATRSRQGPFSQVARRQADGSLREEG